MHCVIFGSIPGLCPLDASNAHASFCDNQKYLQLLSNVLWDGGEQNCPQLRTTLLEYKIFLFTFFFLKNTSIWIERVSLITQLVKNLPAMQEIPVQFGKIYTGEGIGYPLQYSWASLEAQLVKNLPIKRETWVPSLGWEDPLHSSILTWGIPWIV